MEPFSASPIATVGLILGVLVVGWLVVGGRHVDPREPPDLKATIPFVGHLWNFARYRFQYFDQLSAANPSYPIFSVSFLHHRMYVVTGPDLIGAAHRSSTLSFGAVVNRIEKRFMGSSDQLADLMEPLPGHVESPFGKDRMAAAHTLRPGPALNKMNSAVLNHIAKIVGKVGAEWEQKNAWNYMQNTFITGSTHGTFGAKYPVVHSQELQDALWDFEAGQLAMISVPFPRLIASKPYEARAKLQAAIREWHRAGHYKDDDVSLAAKSRIEVNLKYNIPIDDIGNDGLGLLFVSTVNAMPTLFWYFLYVFSSPSLVAELHAELQNVITHTGNKIVIDHTLFPTHCPLLCSAYQETLRLSNIQPGVRYAIEDTILALASDTGARREYLIKKGSMVQTPASRAHTSEPVWGPTVLDFDPRRFMNLGNGDKAAEKAQRRSFIPFGGGKHLCPGRHFAFAELVGTVALLILGFDVEGEQGGKLKMPEGRYRDVSTSVLKPDGEGMALGFKIRRKVGMEDVEWSFVLPEA